LEKSLFTGFERVNNENNNRTYLPSGLNGKALEISLDDIPSRKAVREAIPKHCFRGDIIQ
jgi:omega-6 fatty acid desaturase (delta-12 desaturase)